jgi:hypothetical protein
MNNWYAPLHYDGELTDDEPQVVVLMSQTFLSFVRGAFERVTRSAAWEADDDYDAATFQALDAMSRLLGEDVATVFPYSKNIYLDPLALNWITAGGKEFIQNSSQFHNGFWRNATPVNGEQIFRVTVAIPAGTCWLTITAAKGTGSGQFTMLTDGVDVNPEREQDLYSASPVYNYAANWYVENLSAGVHEFIIKNSGKRAASSNYYLNVSGLSIYAGA